MLSAAALIIALGLSLPVGGSAAQEASSLEAAMREGGVTDKKTLDAARQADEIKRLMEERELSDEESAVLDYLESAEDPAQAMRQYMNERNAESE
jgi:hypothetical protein